MDDSSFAGSDSYSGLSERFSKALDASYKFTEEEGAEEFDLAPEDFVTPNKSHDARLETTRKDYEKAVEKLKNSNAVKIKKQLGKLCDMSFSEMIEKYPNAVRQMLLDQRNSGNVSALAMSRAMFCESGSLGVFRGGINNSYCAGVEVNEQKKEVKVHKCFNADVTPKTSCKKINKQMGGMNRENAGNYTMGVTAGEVAHELGHLLSLDEEYDDSSYPLASLGEVNSLMNNSSVMTNDDEWKDVEYDKLSRLYRRHFQQMVAPARYCSNIMK